MPVVPTQPVRVRGASEIGLANQTTTTPTANETTARAAPTEARARRRGHRRGWNAHLEGVTAARAAPNILHTRNAARGAAVDAPFATADLPDGAEARAEPDSTLAGRTVSAELPDIAEARAAQIEGPAGTAQLQGNATTRFEHAQLPGLSAAHAAPNPTLARGRRHMARGRSAHCFRAERRRGPHFLSFLQSRLAIWATHKVISCRALPL